MTVGLIIGILVAIVIFILFFIFKRDDYYFIELIIYDIFFSSLIGLTICSCISFGCKQYIIHNYSKEEYLVKVNEEKYELYGAKIISDSKFNNNIYLIYTDKENTNTEKLKFNSIKLIDEDINSSYIIIKTYNCKYRKLTHSLDTIVYEYHGKISDLYK